MRTEDESVEEDKPFAREGYALMGAAFEVHQELGGGLLEEFYQESLELELEFRGIPFNSKEQLTAVYKGRPLRKRYIPDLLVFDGIVAELKSVAAIAPAHEAKLIHYMRMTHRPVGYLINFGPIARVEWKRFVLSQFGKKENR